MAKINFDELVEPMEELVKDALKDLVTGAAADIQAFGLEIAKNMARAVSLGRKDLIDNLVGQTRMLAELQRVKAVNAAWDTVERVLKVAGNFALKVVATAV